MDDVCRKWNVTPASLNALKTWFRQQKHLPQSTPDEYLAQFLHSCYYDLERAKKALEFYFRMKSSTPEFFDGRSMSDESIQRISQVCEVGVLQGTTAEGYTVIMGRLKDTNPSSMVYEDAIKYLYMIVDVVMREKPACPGILFAYDITGYGLRHLFKVSLSTVKKYFDYVQECCPMRHKGVHVLNASGIMSSIVTLIMPFMYKEHAQKLIIHSTSQFENFSKLIPESSLPVEYGGKGTSLEKLQEDTNRRLKKYDAWFKFDETLRVDGINYQNNNEKDLPRNSALN